MMNKRKKKKSELSGFILSAFLIFGIAPATSWATIISYDLSFEFSGAQSPTGSDPWVTFTFDDSVGTDQVLLTITNVGLTGTEFNAASYWNIDPAIDPDNVLISYTDTAAITGDGVLTTGTNCCKADGVGGYFDFLWEFDTSAGDGRFTAGESVSLTMEAAGLLASSFDFLSFDEVFSVAAHIQGIGEDGSGSGWISVPEPQTLTLFCLGLLLLIQTSRKRAIV